MEIDKAQTIKMLLDANVLSFGEFTLKSGRVSPYFFNLGNIFKGRALAMIAKAYAALLHQDFPDAQCLFGPAYKGIPLASSTAVCAYQLYKRSLGVTFDRKEAKQHGEGGDLVGSVLAGNIVLVDDVITAGSAVRASMKKINQALAQNPKAKGQVQGLIVAMDRQEAQQEGGPSAIQALQVEAGIKVSALLSFSDLVDYISDKPEFSQYLQAMHDYRSRYGAETRVG